MNKILNLLDECIKKDLWFEINPENSVKLREYVKSLQKENKILKDNAEYNDKVVDNIRWENKKLKEQLIATNKGLRKVVSKRKKWKNRYQNTKHQLKQRDKDVIFCLHSIKQEMDMSTDGRTRQEMKSCYEILQRYKGDNNE